MKVLAFDTATESCSIALLTDGEVKADVNSLEKGTHSRRLMPMIDSLLHCQSLRLSEIDGFATTIGPGSFTGLRIGISTLKGLVAATGKPVAAISTLEALAHQCTVDTDLICPLLDARKKEVYYCFYKRTPDGLKALTSERNATPATAIEQIESACAFIGDGAVAYRELIRSILGRNAIFARDTENAIRASTVAVLANKRFMVGDTDDPFSLAPHYIRESDAVAASL